MTVAEFLHKIFKGLINTCKEVGLTEEDIKAGMTKANKMLKEINFDDKDRVDEISKVIEDECNDLGDKSDKK